jgi:hypothetical protein
MFRHNDVSDDRKPISISNPLERQLKQTSGLCSTKIGQAAVTTERDEMQIAAMLVTMEAERHLEISILRWTGMGRWSFVESQVPKAGPGAPLMWSDHHGDLGHRRNDQRVLKSSAKAGVFSSNQKLKFA